MSSNPANSKELTNRLQLLQAAETWSARLLGGWMPGIANWEAKHRVGLHLWQDLQVARDLRIRLWELRIAKPDRFEQRDELEQIVRRLACAQHDTEAIGGVYLGLKRTLCDAYRVYLDQTHTTWDAPTLPILERAQAQHESQIEWAEAYLASETGSEEQHHGVTRWVQYARDLFAPFLLGSEFGDPPDHPPAHSCLLPFSEARRDCRFKTQLGGFERADPEDHDAHAVWQFLNYAMEMQAAETLASVLWEATGMEWEFYYDVGRHCYDECRHSQMGEERLKELGHSLREFPQFVGNFAWRQLYDPLRRYAMLTYVIEQDSFALKHESYKKYVEQGDTRSAEAILYDIIDETMHVRWGVKWVPELINAQNEEFSVEEIVAQARQAVLENSLSPAQRSYGE
jgi:hypothetical protein